ncbi:MAG: Hsp20/alpha crystallin family protein [Desulfocurvibacter africanus]
MFRNLLPAMRRRTAESGLPASMSDLMEDLWRSPFGGFSMLEKAEFPSVDVSESENEVMVKAELPGLEAKDVDISLENNQLIIRGEKRFEEEEKKENYHRIERSYGSFFRSVPMPIKVKQEGIKAKFDKGVLRITLPKDEAAKSRKIEIEA